MIRYLPANPPAPLHLKGGVRIAWGSGQSHGAPAPGAGESKTTEVRCRRWYGSDQQAGGVPPFRMGAAGRVNTRYLLSDGGPVQQH